MRKKMKTARAPHKIFNDSVHGHIELHPLSVRIIDTVEFQRLRDLKQLGTTYSVYPAASHNRFEHSLGVAHLASKFIDHLARVQPELGITEQEKICIEVAGLVHDIGHGVLSHVFDGSFIPAIRPKSQWQHEWGSLRMFDHLIEENNLKEVFMDYGIDDDKIHFIKEIILGDSEDAPPEFMWRGMPPEKMYLYEIVANKVSGIDVDKWDYFQRDCKQLNMDIAFDASRLMKFARVLKKADGNTTIAYAFKEAWNVYQLFASRYSLHKRAYQHRVSCVIEKMYLDAMIAADEHIKLRTKDGKSVTMSQSIDDMSAYAKLSDWILRYILSSPDENLAPARAMLERILRRDLYPFVGEAMIPVPPHTSTQWTTSTRELQEAGINVLKVCGHNKLIYDKKHIATDDDETIACSQLPIEEPSILTDINDSPSRGNRFSQLSSRRLDNGDISDLLESQNVERASQVRFLDDSTDNPIVILDGNTNNLSDENVVLNDTNPSNPERTMCQEPECKAPEDTGPVYKKWGKAEIARIEQGILDASKSLTQRELYRARHQLMLNPTTNQLGGRSGTSGSSMTASQERRSSTGSAGSFQRQVGQKSKRQGTLNFRPSQQTGSSLPGDYIYSTPLSNAPGTLEPWEKLTKDDFIVDLITINCGKGNKDPVESVTFYEIDSHNNIVEKKVHRSQISVFMPYAYEEQYVRVYCKDKRKYHIVYSAFEKLWAEKKESKPLMNTPARNIP